MKSWGSQFFTNVKFKHYKYWYWYVYSLNSFHLEPFVLTDFHLWKIDYLKTSSITFYLFVHLTTLFRARQTSWSHQKFKNTGPTWWWWWCSGRWSVWTWSQPWLRSQPASPSPVWDACLVPEDPGAHQQRRHDEDHPVWREYSEVSRGLVWCWGLTILCVGSS